MEIATILNETKTQLQQLYGSRLKGIRLYGSWARDEGTSESDIDLVVILDQVTAPGREIEYMIDIITEINLKYNALISVYPVSQADFSALNTPLLINMRRESVPA